MGTVTVTGSQYEPTSIIGFSDYQETYTSLVLPGGPAADLCLTLPLPMQLSPISCIYNTSTPLCPSARRNWLICPVLHRGAVSDTGTPTSWLISSNPPTHDHEQHHPDGLGEGLFFDLAALSPAQQA